jgi:hypothetical protein
MAATAGDRDVFLNTGHVHRGWKDMARSAIFRMIAPLPDPIFCALKYFALLGRFPNLRNPRTFTDKVQARKLYDRNPLFPTMVDKADVKALIAQRVGPRYVIPTQWVGKALSDVDWSAITLPAVVKPTHASGVGRLLRTPDDVAALMAEDPSEAWLAIRHAAHNREWAYSEIEPRILIEPMLQANGSIPADYRFFTFDGKVSHIEVDFNVEHHFSYCNYTPDWEKLPFRDPGYDGFHEGEVDPPLRLAEMIRVAESLGHGLDFVRVDIYACDEWIRVGELTLYPGGGFEGFDPPEYDLLIGKRWRLGFTIPSKGSHPAP